MLLSVPLKQACLKMWFSVLSRDQLSHCWNIRPRSSAHATVLSDVRAPPVSLTPSLVWTSYNLSWPSPSQKELDERAGFALGCCCCFLKKIGNNHKNIEATFSFIGVAQSWLSSPKSFSFLKNFYTVHVYIRYLVCCAIRFFFSSEYSFFFHVITIGVSGFLNIWPSGGMALKIVWLWMWSR